MKNINKIIFSFILFLVTCNLVYADAGVPMVFITLPYMIIGLIPIIVIEMFVLKRVLNISYKIAAKSTTISNIASTILGMPITWIILVLAQMMLGGGSSHGITTLLQKLYAVTIQAPWLIPYESDLYWMVPTASMVLLIPYFFMSVWIESLISTKIIASTEEELLIKAVLKANIASYLFLAATNIVWLIYSVQQNNNKL